MKLPDPVAPGREAARARILAAIDEPFNARETVAEAREWLACHRRFLSALARGREDLDAMACDSHSLEVDYETLLNRAGILSFRFHSLEYPGMAHGGMSFWKCFIFSATTGEALAMTDLLAPGAVGPFMARLAAAIRAVGLEDVSWVGKLEDFENLEVGLSRMGVEVGFMAGVFGHPTEGYAWFCVPYGELKGLARPGSPLAALAGP